ncbi:MAG: cadmium-translocating P-type ATPase [Gammaproteobacteria bacterium]|nr:MAG: cadmium-translocating P-type ATPase [Gammaproteobacteria bacterium]
MHALNNHLKSCPEHSVQLYVFNLSVSELITMTVNTSPCFHCGQPVKTLDQFGLKIDGEHRQMCCKGCEAVAEAIINGGMGDYYKHRTEHAESIANTLPDFIQQLRTYDLPEIQKSFVQQKEGAIREATLILEGINCAACIWLNEQCISGLKGVLSISINYSTRRARLRWDNEQIQLSDVLNAIHDIGYKAYPYDAEQQQELLEKEQKLHIRRLGLAAMLGMQVMILTVALYVGEWRGIDEGMRRFFTWLGLGLTLPVLLYSARPFFESAWRDLKQHRAGMDVPVSLGMFGAFAVSTINTISGEGPVYYESVCMFVLFLLTARYFEFIARKRALETSETLTYSQPTVATLITTIDGENSQETVPAMQLVADDLILVRPGEVIPADGIILEGNSSVDESILTGESRPIRKIVGGELIGGSVNIESSLTVKVSHAAGNSLLSHLGQLVDQAQSEKPKLVLIADRIASHFVIVVLIITSAVGFWWWQSGSENWISITLSLLVVTCPCAFSLATPTAVTAAMGKFLSTGLLVTSSTALEALAGTNHFVFDKTGTLTKGKMEIREIGLLGSTPQEEVLIIATALESFSEHPIARAFAISEEKSPAKATQVTNHTGAGVEGQINGERYYIGSPRFIKDKCGQSKELSTSSGTPVVLASEKELLALFWLDDQLKDEAKPLINSLQAAGCKVTLLSGDHNETVREIAISLGIDDYYGEMKPEDKLKKLRQFQQQGETVTMVGDGVNDAPVLAAANVSIAMTEGARLAQSSADLIMLSDHLMPIAEAKNLSQKLLSVIRQNLFWAIGYNLIALPAAALGFVPPWLAALGMSASSLVVVANSLRLSKKG